MSSRGYGDPNNTRRRQCINCSFLVRRNMHTYSLEQASGAMLNILRHWITPTQPSPESILCAECFLLLQERVNAINQENEIPQPAFGHRSVCFSCGESILRSTRTYPVKHDRPERDFLLRLVPLHLVSRFERVCAACWRSAYRNVQRQRQHDDNRPNLQEVELRDDIRIPVPPQLPPQRQQEVSQEMRPKITFAIYRRAANTSNHCIFLNCFEPERLIVPAIIKEHVLLNYKFYIPSGARICHHHLYHGTWSELTSRIRDFNRVQFENMMQMMERASRHQIDFSNIALMPPHLCHYWLGMSSEQFQELLNCVPHLANEVPNASLALCMFLVKLRTGESDERLATLFNKHCTTLERYMTKARQSLSSDFVPLHLGFGHMTVEEVAARNKIIPEGLFGNPNLLPDVKPAIVLCDATYVYIQSSANYLFQRQTYSLHKLDNLVKPFMIVCCNGHIVDCMGPYKATTNDATITSMNLRGDESMLRSFFRRGDIFILDRGFRDVTNELNQYGFVTHMPETLQENEHQLTTIQANRSRLVTMCRWVVEVINGRVKRDYRIFRNVFNNRAATHLKENFRIACALINKFHVLIEDPPEALEYIVRIAKNRLSLEKHLAIYVEGENVNRRVNFQNIDSNNPHLDRFPRLTITDLKRIALGTYQIKQAKSYYGEHVRQNGIYSIEINSEVDDDVPLVLGLNNYLLRGRIRSRHVSSRTYYTYLLISQDEVVTNTTDALRVIAAVA